VRAVPVRRLKVEGDKPASYFLFSSDGIVRKNLKQNRVSMRNKELATLFVKKHPLHPER
jgi:hypothetical protein